MEGLARADSEIKDVLPEGIDRTEESYKREILKLRIENERLKKLCRADDGYWEQDVAVLVEPTLLAQLDRSARLVTVWAVASRLLTLRLVPPRPDQSPDRGGENRRPDQDHEDDARIDPGHHSVSLRGSTRGLRPLLTMT